MVKNVNDIYNSFLTIPALVGETDLQTDKRTDGQKSHGNTAPQITGAIKILWQ